MENEINSIIKDKLLTLARELLADRPRPKDKWEISTLLEIFGKVDTHLLSETGTRDIFELAEKIYEVIPELKIKFTDEILKEKKKKPFFLVRFFKYYIKGLFFAMPMTVQVFAMLLFQCSLWAWMYFTVAESSAIAIGTIGSFIITGGFIQSIGRKGLYYIHQDEHILTMKISYRFFWIGFFSVFLFAGLFLLAQFIFDLFPLWMVQYILIYYFLLSFLWLCFAILYMLKRTVLCTIIVAVGILIVHLVLIFGVNVPLFKGRLIVWAHIVGLSSATIIAFVSGYLILRRMAKKAEERFKTKELPKFSMLIYSILPYFLYGFCYFLFLSLDRLISWSCHKEIIPYIITFRVPYELGMDWALCSLILTIGVLEYIIEEFSQTVIPNQIHFKATESQSFNIKYLTFYNGNLILFLGVAIFSILFVYFGMFILAQLNRTWKIFYGIEHFFNPVTYFVFFFAAIGYVFMIWGLFNSIFFFALSRPGFVLKSIIPAILVDFIVGFIISRMFGYYFGVIGLFFGALAFMIISSFYAQKVFSRLDYYYYSAY